MGHSGVLVAGLAEVERPMRQRYVDVMARVS